MFFSEAAAMADRDMTAQPRLKSGRAPSLRPSSEIGRQAQKSASTRKLIVEAALQCLIKYGYSQTTTPRIAEEAGLSRGAMMHHFSNRLTVIQAAIEHLHAKRLRAFKRAVSSLPENAPHLHDALEAYWRHVTHPLFVAFHELAVASRTDKELERILRPAQDAFYQAWYELAVDLFPEWQSEKASFDLALHLVQVTLEGLAISRLASTANPTAEARLFEYLEARLLDLMPVEMKSNSRYDASRPRKSAYVKAQSPRS
jgi:AcrR family transcriptional regulator